MTYPSRLAHAKAAEGGASADSSSPSATPKTPDKNALLSITPSLHLQKNSVTEINSRARAADYIFQL
jgi:hypothetical protein